MTVAEPVRLVSRCSRVMEDPVGQTPLGDHGGERGPLDLAARRLGDCLRLDEEDPRRSESAPVADGLRHVMGNAGEVLGRQPIGPHLGDHVQALGARALALDPDGGRISDAGDVVRGFLDVGGDDVLAADDDDARLAERVDELGQTVVVKFIQLIRAWPDPAWSFAVNPGTPVGATLPGGQIVALASWAAEVGLGIDSEDEAAQAPAAVEEVPAPTREPARDEHGQPPMMQKVVAPGHVAYYLERGYDRVSGFVHRVTEVAHLHTPEKLIAALGLRYTDSPFGPDGTEVYVLRWPAYRPSLYRIPYGGQNEAAMRAMEGWVIERPPFRGNGFAPGDSSEVVAEFKVDSARLPHGAQLWRVSTEDGEKLVAVLDSDQSVWRRVGED